MSPVIPEKLYRGARPGYSPDGNQPVGMGQVQTWIDAAIVPDNAAIVWSDAIIAARPHGHRAGAMTHNVIEWRAGPLYK
jgi:hypothetical protein